MWYLAYGFDGRSSPIPTNLEEETDASNISGADSQPETITNGINFKEKGKPRKGPKMYRDSEVDWKMFVPPLPQHSGYPQGWVLISDALLAMPLSIFCQIITINYKVDDLSSYLEHPKKRHLLLRHLPSRMRQQLLHGRKYIFCFHEFCTRLCYMGLLSFGPHHVSINVICVVVFLLSAYNLVFSSTKYIFLLPCPSSFSAVQRKGSSVCLRSSTRHSRRHVNGGPSLQPRRHEQTLLLGRI